MSRILLLLTYLICSTMNLSMAQKPIVYLISGQGSDERIFSEIPWDTSHYDVQYIPFIIPNRRETMNGFAHRMSQSIDTSRFFLLVGVSLGGMVCSEMKTFLNPEKVILISSAKCRGELPLRYRFQRYLPIYGLVPKRAIKWGAQIAQPIVEPDRKVKKDVFKAMLKAKNPTFLKRSIRMIVNWNKPKADSEIIHIHGDSDHTLPYRRIANSIPVENGSHMMTLTRSEEVSAILTEFLPQ
jgi:pimeloyl-ACP methyl ester carboxylesterase